MISITTKYVSHQTPLYKSSTGDAYHVEGIGVNTLVDAVGQLIENGRQEVEYTIRQGKFRGWVKTTYLEEYIEALPSPRCMDSDN